MSTWEGPLDTLNVGCVYFWVASPLNRIISGGPDQTQSAPWDRVMATAENGPSILTVVFAIPQITVVRAECILLPDRRHLTFDASGRSLASTSIRQPPAYAGRNRSVIHLRSSLARIRSGQISRCSESSRWVQGFHSLIPESVGHGDRCECRRTPIRSVPLQV